MFIHEADKTVCYYVVVGWSACLIIDQGVKWWGRVVILGCGPGLRVFTTGQVRGQTVVDMSHSMFLVEDKQMSMS